ncbi:hypothetical protein AAFF_G00140390 [Aldrovandia affinis]|uniref:Cold-shock domain-containing protein n=1 Tax=Aldrovandia affinis TaxID=143900 RepID=A0AAD7TCB9_9TELE|nr:hypothetical protein AAFF_G00140390 [Aldrovandia affinis]
MARGGGRRKRGNGRFFPRGQGPRFPMCPDQPPPPDIGWNRPPFPDGHPGGPGPDLNFMDNSVGFRPMMEPDYGPMDESGFDPVDQDFRPHVNRLGGPRPMMDRDHGPYTDTAHDEIMNRGYGEIDSRELGSMSDRPMITPPSEFRDFGQSFGGRDLGPMEQKCGSAMPMERGFGQLSSSERGPMMDCGPMMDRGFGPSWGEPGPVDRNYAPVMHERGFGSTAMPMERGLGTVDDREFSSSSIQCQDERMYFGGQFHGPPDQGMGMQTAHDNGPGPRMMEQPRWIDTSGMPPPGPHHANQMTPTMPGPPNLGPPQGEHPDPPVSKKLKPPKRTKKLDITKPTPGRFQGIISFVGTNYGFIECDDLKKIHFSFEAFWGDPAKMLPGVRVQFTIYKNKGNECATDVMVPPGGTEEVDNETFQGVVCRVNSQNAGRIQSTLFSMPLLPFVKQDCRPTLLQGDQVKFSLVTDLVTKQKRATNITLMPDTFQFTGEHREMGVLMNTKDGSGSIMSEEWSNLCFDANENLDETELSIMDEVSFTVIPAKGEEQQKAVRVRKLTEGTVTFGKKTRERIAEVIEKQDPPTSLTLEQGKWKAVTSEVLPQRTVIFEDVSSEQYEGTILKAAPKTVRKQVDSEPEALPGLLVATVAGAVRKLPFGAGDVLSEATMMQRDRVQFNISTNRGTKMERATNIEILPGTLGQSNQQREKGTVVDLRESFGFIKCQRDPRMFFHLKEVMEESKVNLMDEVEFTVLPASAGEGDQAVRVRKLLWSAFTATPKLEGLGAATKEKKKMTIKLLRDSVNDEMKNLKVKIESFNTDDFPKDHVESLNGNASSEPGADGLVTPKSENDLEPGTIDWEDDAGKVKGQEKTAYTKRSPNADPHKQKEEKGEGKERSGSMERNFGSRPGKFRSVAKENIRSRSRERSGRCSGGRSPSQGSEHTDTHVMKCSSSDKPGADGLVPPKSENDSQPGKIDWEDDAGKRKGQEKTSYTKSSPNADPHKQKDEKGEGRGNRLGKYQIPSQENIRKRSRSREQAPRKCERRRSRSRSHESSARGSSGRRPSRSREHADTRVMKRSGSRERAASQVKRRSPEWDSSSHKKSSVSDAKDVPVTKERGKVYPGPVAQNLPRSDNILDEELSRKKRELELLEEHIARKRAIIAMEQKGLALKVQSKQEQESESGCYRCSLPLGSEEATRPAPLPIKSILKKRTEPFAEPVSYQQSEFPPNPPLGQKFLSQPPCDLPPVTHPPPQQISGHYFDKPPDHPPLSQSVSQHTPIRHPPHSQSSFSHPPVCHSTPCQQPPTNSGVSTQFERFLRTLNKGVDVNLLSSLVKEAREDTVAFKGPASRKPPQAEVPLKDRDQNEDCYGRRPKEPEQPEDLGESGQDFLLPHERAFQDGSGFSRIVGMKHGLQVEELHWREGDVEDEERFLYGERASADEDQGKSSTEAAADRRRREPSPPEKAEKSEDKMQHYKIQSLLQTIGLELDTAEVSKLADRTRERLYGTKLKSKPPGPGEQQLGRAGGRTGRQWSRTDSPESDRTRSISPVQSSRREVYMTYQGAMEHSSTHDQRTQQISTLSRTVQHAQDPISPSCSAPSVPQYSHVPPDPYSQYEGAQQEHAYRQHGSTIASSWGHVPQQSEMQAPPGFSQQPESFLRLPSPFVNIPVSPHGLSPFLPSPSLPHMRLTSAVGLPPELSAAFLSPPSVPLPSFVGQPPPAVLPYAGAASYYPLHPLTGVPILTNASLGGISFPILQPVVVGKGEGGKKTKEPAPTKTRCLRRIKTIKFSGQMTTPTIFLKEVPMISTQNTGSTPAPFSTPSESTERRLVTTISEDDIKAKQKKRLEQFNERMRRKKEQQMEAKRSRTESQKIPPGKTCTEVKNVWICGHSLVFWAEKRAKSPEYGMQLGMDPSRVRIWWKGMQGLTWDQLLPLLLKLKGNWPNPDVLILHLGGNDLGKSDTRVLLAAVKKDLTSLRSIFPQCLLVWSDILPRRSWRTTEDAEAVESFRVLVNRRVLADIAELGGAALSHSNIRPGSDVGLYRPDGVHLSGKGIDMFNIDMQDFLEKWEGEMSGTASAS